MQPDSAHKVTPHFVENICFGLHEQGWEAPQSKGEKLRGVKVSDIKGSGAESCNNDGDPFVWTSNFQVISKVYLEKHLSLPRTYLFNKKDGKMVKQGMAKMVQPE